MAKLLLVEDDKLLLKVYKNILEKENHQLTLAEDGEKALFHLLEGGFDFILLDIKLPKKDGIQILTELQQRKPKEKNGPIVILSNVNEEKTIKKAISLGAVGYITKDQLNPRFLAAEVKKYIEQKDNY